MQIARSSTRAFAASAGRRAVAPRAALHAVAHGRGAAGAAPAAAPRAAPAAPRPAPGGRARAARVAASWGAPVEWKPAKARARAHRRHGGLACMWRTPALPRAAAPPPPPPRPPPPRPPTAPPPPPPQVVGSSKATDTCHKLLVDVGADAAAGYTKGGQYVQLKVGDAPARPRARAPAQPCRSRPGAAARPRPRPVPASAGGRLQARVLCNRVAARPQQPGRAARRPAPPRRPPRGPRAPPPTPPLSPTHPPRTPQACWNS